MSVRRRRGTGSPFGPSRVAGVSGITVVDNFTQIGSLGTNTTRNTVGARAGDVWIIFVNGYGSNEPVLTLSDSLTPTQFCTPRWDSSSWSAFVYYAVFPDDTQRSATTTMASSYGQMACVVLRGVDTSNLLDFENPWTENASSTTQVVSGDTTTSDNAYAISMLVVKDNSALTGPSESGWTYLGGDDFANSACFRMAGKVIPIAGSTGDTTYTEVNYGPDVGAGTMFALTPLMP